MKKNRLGKSNTYVSELGLGCMSLGTDEKHAKRIIHEALEHGVNFLDTADLYEYGLNESFVGKAIQGKRNQVVLATKVGNRWQEGIDGWRWDPSKAYIKEAVKQSLSRLQTDYIDLYQLHGGTIEDPIDEIIEAFEDLKAEGFIKTYGISSIRPNVIKEYVERSNISSVMMQYSMLDRRPEEQMLDFLFENNISVIARGPLAKGLLTDKWQETFMDKFAKKGFLEYSPDELKKLLHDLNESLQGERSLQSLAMHYPIQHPAVATMIPGASSVQQLVQNIYAYNDQKMTEEECKIIRSFTKAYTYKQHRI
jgi:aryl-alcohol dehydrogenase-like predicted oxidoreductase